MRGLCRSLEGREIINQYVYPFEQNNLAKGNKMKKAFIKSILTTLLFSLFLYPSISAAETILIENNSFAVITEDDKKNDAKCKKVALYLENKACIITYKAILGDSTLGAGQIDTNSSPQTITLGNSKIRIACQIQGKVKVTK